MRCFAHGCNPDDGDNNNNNNNNDDDDDDDVDATGADVSRCLMTLGTVWALCQV